MLDLTPADEHLAVADVARAMGLELLSPAAREAEAAGAVPAALWKSLLDSGLTVPVSEERGGDGEPDTLTQMIAIENLAYGDPGIALAAAWSGAAAFVLGRHGSAEPDGLLSALLSDPAARGSIALYEGDRAGAVGVRDHGQREHRRHRACAGPQGRRAVRRIASDFLVVGRAADGKLSVIVVPNGTPGVIVEPSPGHLALDAAGARSVSFDVTVPAVNLVGGPGAEHAGACRINQPDPADRRSRPDRHGSAFRRLRVGLCRRPDRLRPTHLVLPGDLIPPGRGANTNLRAATGTERGRDLAG